MARTRMIKPEFFRSRSLAQVSRDARLTFIGMWMEADSAGRGIADARLIHGAIWPLEDDISRLDVEQHIDALEMTGHIRLYAVGDETYYVIVNWEKHQSAAYRTGATQFPEPTECETVQPAQETVQAAHAPSSRLVPIVEGKGREVLARPPEQLATARPPRKPQPSAAEFDQFWQAYPKKLSKKDAQRAYAKARRDTDAAVILKALQGVQRDALDPERYRFIPYPASWLNKCRWLDEPPNGHVNGLLPGQRMRDGIVLETRQ